MTDLALGLDLGGTNIRAAIVDRAGVIIARHAVATPRMADGHIGLPDHIVTAITDCARPLLGKYNIVAAGMGCGGQFSPASGIWRGINTGHPAFIDYPLGERLNEALGLAVSIDSDVKTAAYGELHAGSGRGFRHLICAAVGTGVGGAIIIDGQLFHGATGLAGHLGQIPGAVDGVLIEDLAGGTSLARIATAEGVLQPGQSTRDLFALARDGHSGAQGVIDRAGAQLGRVLTGMAHMLEPEAVLIGGSVGVQAEYLAAVDAGMQAVLMPNWQHIRPRAMTLGPDAGQIGAALRAFADHTS